MSEAARHYDVSGDVAGRRLRSDERTGEKVRAVSA
jgi:hypothetical protein